MASSLQPKFDLSQLDSSNRLVQINLYLSIPEKYHQEPIISKLANSYGLNVNILAATLGKNGKGNGWFHLSLSGKSQAVKDALIYLEELDITLLNDQETDGW